MIFMLNFRRIAGILDVDYDCHTAECIRSRGV